MDRLVFDTPLLTAAEEVTLALQMEAGLLAAEALVSGHRPDGATTAELGWLVAAGQRARERYVQANLRLVASVAGPASARAQLSEADLFQEGCLGLMTAVDRFDARRGCRFSTYALAWIRAYVGAATSRSLGTANLPVSRAAQLRHARGVEAVLAQELGRPPTAPEVGAALGRTAAWTASLLAHELPQTLDDIGDVAVEDPGLASALDDAPRAGQLLAVLDGFERRVLGLLIGLDGEPCSYADVARLLAVSSNRVRRAERRGLERLRAVCPQAARERLVG